MARYSADKIKVRLLKAWMRRLCFNQVKKIRGRRTRLRNKLD